MPLSKISICLLLLIPFLGVARKKPRSLCECKSLVVLNNQSIAFNSLTDSLLLRVWDVDSVTGVDTRWEIRCTREAWVQTVEEYGCEKQIVNRKILFLFPQTKFVYEPFHRVRSFNFQQPITQILSKLDSLSAAVSCGKPSTRHIVRFEYFTAISTRVFDADLTDNAVLIKSILSVFERDAIILHDK